MNGCALLVNETFCRVIFFAVAVGFKSGERLFTVVCMAN